MIPLDLAKISVYLKTQNIQAEFQKETNQLCLLLKIGERDYPLFIRIYESEEMLQLLSFLPCNTKKETLGDTARLLHLLNKEIDVPGFGMDEESHVVFYRCMIPSKNKQIDKKIFDAFLNASQIACQSFAAVVAGVAFGAVSFDEVIKRTKEQSSQSLSQAHLKREK